jgi:hypothetical protein
MNLCISNWELVDHLLLHCLVSTELWSFVFTLNSGTEEVK